MPTAIYKEKARTVTEADIAGRVFNSPSELQRITVTLLRAEFP